MNKEENKTKIPCDLDHNGECLICDCWISDCAFQRYLNRDYKYESKEQLEHMFKDYVTKEDNTEPAIYGGGYTCEVCGQYQRTSALCHHINLIPKDITQGYICPVTKVQCDDECCVSAEDCHIEAGVGILSSEEIKETLEEAAIRLYPDNIIKLGHETSYNAALLKRKDFIDGGNWMKERMHTIEDFFNMIEEYREKELPNRNVPYHYEAEIDSGLKYLITFIKGKQPKDNK
jgi:hypothetical protein